jgi:hypothetical protein
MPAHQQLFARLLLLWMRCVSCCSTPFMLDGQAGLTLDCSQKLQSQVQQSVANVKAYTQIYLSAPSVMQCTSQHQPLCC